MATPETPPKTDIPQAKQTDITKSSRSLAIALIVSAVFLVSAAGIAAWLVFSRTSADIVGDAISQPSADDTKNVKSVTLVAPASLPAHYVKNDQSTNTATTIHYYDDATNCGFTVSVIPLQKDKTAKDVIVEAVTAAETQGVTTTKATESEGQGIKDADTADITYKFAAVALEQSVNVQGVAFTGQHMTILYKQFGVQVASVAYACKNETWADKQAELAALAMSFTAKTER